MELIPFTKMHGIGNDYVYINCLDSTPACIEELAIEMSRTHTGIGSDGIILILPSATADFRMRIFNADGSEAKMCGNGSRCVAKFLVDNKLTDSKTITLETLSGVKTLYIGETSADGAVTMVTVDMGQPSLMPADIGMTIANDAPTTNLSIDTSDGTYLLTAVSMGNPHGVIFLDDDRQPDVHQLGRELEHHTMWSDRANIEFARITSPDTITVRVWERGSGETMACGTGACATAVAAWLHRLDAPTIHVTLPGGTLSISRNDCGHIMMTGPAQTVFSGTYIRRSSHTHLNNNPA